MLDTFVARWRTLSTAQQLIIGALAALVVYFIVTNLGSLNPSYLLAVAGILLLALPLHEFAHAATAVALGDDTPRLMGRLTLNPLAHLDPVGSLLILISGFGWAKPVMWNPRNITVSRRWGAILVAVAGPLTNLALAIVAFAILGWAGAAVASSPVLVRFLYGFATINVALAVFNLIPIPPLDGSHVLFSLLPGDQSRLRAQLSQFGMLIVFGMVILFPNLLHTPIAAVMGFLESIFLT